MRARRFQIVILPRAHLDLVEIEARIAIDSPRNAAALGDRILNRIWSLRVMPHRYPVYIPAGEYQHEVRKMSVYPCRVLYMVEGGRVVVLRVRHGKQQDLTAQDL